MDVSTRERYQYLAGAYREAKATRSLRNSMSRFTGNRIATYRGSEVRTAAEQLIAGVGRDVLRAAGFGETDIEVSLGACLDHPEGAADALVAWVDELERAHPMQVVHASLPPSEATRREFEKLLERLASSDAQEVLR